jgi:integrase/recombinase XerD
VSKTRAALNPPEHWPSEAKALYRDFQARLKLRIVSWRSVLRVLRHLFSQQKERGLQWRDLPGSLCADFLAGATTHNWQLYRMAVRAWLRFLYARNVLLMPLHKELPSRKRPPYLQRRPLSYDQVLQSMNLIPLNEPQGLRDRAIVEVAYGTAMRRGELQALDLCDVDLTAGTIYIGQAKNSYQRIVPLTRWAQHFFRRYLLEARPHLSSEHSGQALWLSDHWGTRLEFGHLSARLRHHYRALEKLDCYIPLHGFRHAAATHLLAGGADIREVQALLGHLSVSSTQIYTHVTPTRLREVHRLHHPRNNGAIPGTLTDSGESCTGWEQP